MEKYDMTKFIEFVADLVSEFDIFYEKQISSKPYFEHGGCYELYKVVKHYFPDAQCVVHKQIKHCAILYENEIFDINGKVDNIDDYRIADAEDLRYMENSFGTHVEQLKNANIITELDKCRVKGILYD